MEDKTKSFMNWIQEQRQAMEKNKELDIARVEGFYSGAMKTLQMTEVIFKSTFETEKSTKKAEGNENKKIS